MDFDEINSFNMDQVNDIDDLFPLFEAGSFNNDFKNYEEDTFELNQIFDSEKVPNIKEDLNILFKEDDLNCTFIKQKNNNQIQLNNATLRDNFLNDDRSNTSNDSAEPQLVVDFYNQIPNQQLGQFNNQFNNSSLNINESPVLSPNHTSLYSPPCHISNNKMSDSSAFQINSFIPQSYVQVSPTSNVDLKQQHPNNVLITSIQQPLLFSQQPPINTFTPSFFFNLPQQVPLIINNQPTTQNGLSMQQQANITTPPLQLITHNNNFNNNSNAINTPINTNNFNTTLNNINHNTLNSNIINSTCNNNPVINNILNTSVSNNNNFNNNNFNNNNYINNNNNFNMNNNINNNNNNNNNINNNNNNNNNISNNNNQIKNIKLETTLNNTSPHLKSSIKAEKVAIARMPGSQPNFGKKKTTHNAIEKKYRLSINDKLLELKEMVGGSGSKMNKSSILKKAIDYIKYLHDVNKKLSQQLKTLNFHRDASSPQDSMLEDHFQQQADNNNIEDDDEDDERNLDTSDCLDSSDLGMYAGSADKSRALLCGLMMVMFVVNPLGLLAGRSETRVIDVLGDINVGKGRMLQGIETETSAVVQSASILWWFVSVCLWLFNAVFTVIFIARLGMFSEPVTESCSKSAFNYWRHRKQAQVFIDEGDFAGAYSHLNVCLLALERPLPTSIFELWLSLSWNSVRQLLHFVPIGRWMESKAGGGIWGRVAPVKAVRCSYADAAWVYHMVLRMHVQGHIVQGKVSGINLALCALNLGEAAGDIFNVHNLSELYILAALTANQVLPCYPFQTLIRFLMRLSFTRHSVHPHLVWINTQEGLRFLFHPDRRCCVVERGCGVVGGGLISDGVVGDGVVGDGVVGDGVVGGDVVNGGSYGRNMVSSDEDVKSDGRVSRSSGSDNVGEFRTETSDVHSSFTLPPLSKSDPLALMSQSYRQYLVLHITHHIILTPSSKLPHHHKRYLMEKIGLLKEVCLGAVDATKKYNDDLCVWWCDAMISCLQSKMPLTQLPRHLYQQNFCLASCLQDIFNINKLILPKNVPLHNISNQPPTPLSINQDFGLHEAQHVFALCNKASLLLAGLMGGGVLDKMWCLKACTMLLNIRTQLLKSPHKFLTIDPYTINYSNLNHSFKHNTLHISHASHAIFPSMKSSKHTSHHSSPTKHCLMSSSQLSFYLTEVSMLRRFSQVFEHAWINNTLNFYEMTLRSVVGANPLKTLKLTQYH